MARKIIYIVLGALLIFGILFLLWTWFFSGSAAAPQNNGQFGTASDTNQSLGTGSGNNGNGETNLGQGGSGQSATNGTIPLGTNGSNGSGSNGLGSGSSGFVTSESGINGASTATLGTPGTVPTTLGSSVSPSGVLWLGGQSFTPADVNSISPDSGGFAPTITTTPTNSGGVTLIEALAATAVAGGLTCALQSGVVTLSTTAAGTATGGAAAVATGGVLTHSGLAPPFSIPGSSPGVINDAGTHAQLAGLGQILGASYAVQAANTAKNAAKEPITFTGCLVNVIGKVALQQITISVVNWINSGFNGQPSFVTNFQQFFTNVADLSAGQFIQGSGLAFLCSPFQLQIKIAVAQSYANKGAQSCSLTGIIKNVNNFMNGNFASGGWAGMLSFTTVPTNNPYGAFAYAQVGLVSAQNQAAANAKNSITPGGFIGLQQQTCTGSTGTTTSVAPLVGQNAQAAMAGNVVPQGCKVSLTTPGTVIQNALNSSENSTINQLGLANDLDQIISALTTQLVTKTLQNGLTSLSQSTTQTPEDLAAQSQAASLLLDMQNRVSFAQQIGSTDQGSISDIQAAQSNLNTLANCWSQVASSSSSQAAQAAQNAAAANANLASFNSQIDAFNNDITTQNATIAAIGQFESDISNAQVDADVDNVTASYNAAVSAGQFPAQADVTTAQQNRTTLQSQLSIVNSATATSLQQCQAITTGTN